MGRELKRVPLDFDWPIGKVWEGYANPACKTCEKEDCSWEECEYHYDPPTGDAYQFWETTSEGSPQTPPFPTLEGLAQYCSEHSVSIFAYDTLTAPEWLELFKEHCDRHFIPYTIGNFTCI